MPATPNHPVLTPEKSKALVEDRLSAEFDDLASEADRIHPRYARFINTIRGLGQTGGKRLRPYMTMLSFEAYSGQPGERILPMAVSLELLHFSMLIHDDVIDRDDTRYGKPNVTAQYLEHYGQLGLSDDDQRHYAESAALLAGDLIQFRAHDMMQEVDMKPDVRRDVRAEMRRTLSSVIAGELIDTENSFDPSVNADSTTVALHKTASYTFVAPLVIGATLAEAPKEEKDALRAIAEDIGVAFQYRDDMIGTFGNPKKTGKSVDSDIREGKRTILTEVFEQSAPDHRREFFQSVWGNSEASDKDVQIARKVLSAYTREVVEGKLRVISLRTRERIGELAIPKSYRTTFRELAVQSMNRNS